MAKSNSRRSADWTKTAVVLSPLAIKRLGAACVAESATQSEVVEQLIQDHLKEYNLQLPKSTDRIKVAKRERKRKSAASAIPVTIEESANSVGSVNLPAQLSL